ncbi:MAG: hypothetical protein ACYTBJ_05395 [Planctomycetota bacterium]|jgi:hypothetical protein
MGVTLEELLENSGVGSLNGEEAEKTASEDARPDDQDLVSALRKYASAPENRQEVIKGEAARELAEKTAEILIIKQTMQEIDKLASLGVQQDQHQKLATFIKTAMDEGHSEQEVAEFLKAASGRVMRAIQGAVQSGRRRSVARSFAKAEGKGAKAAEHETRQLRNVLTRGKPNEIERHLTKMEGHYGRKSVGESLKELKDAGTRIPRSASSWVPRAGDAKVGVTLPGGAEKAVSVAQLKRYGIPGAAAAGGLALGSRGKSKDSGRKGVVVVNS